MQVELLDRQKWETKVKPALALADYIEGSTTPLVGTVPWVTSVTA
jgi:hypothetical protein